MALAFACDHCAQLIPGAPEITLRLDERRVELCSTDCLAAVTRDEDERRHGTERLLLGCGLTG